MRARPIVGLDHAQVAIPEDGEETARRFHPGLLGMTELPKPEPLRANGGFWADTGGAALHLGIDPSFRPARKAHVALVAPDLDAVARALEAAGRPVTRDTVPGRFFTEDPAGNRVEIVGFVSHDAAAPASALREIP